MVSVLAFDTGDAGTGVGQLRRISQNFLRQVSRHPLKRGERAGVCQNRAGSNACLALCVGTVTFKLTLRPRAQCHLRDST